MKRSKSKTVSRYMNLKTDFAFKNILANEQGKELLINLLNEILKSRNKIVDVQYLPTEQIGRNKDERKAIFDIYCTNDKEEHFIIEMQVVRHTNVLERWLYYLACLIKKQAKKGKWNYHIDPVYLVAFMDFSLWPHPAYINYHSLTNEETGEIISDKLHLITIELPKFKKKVNELESNLDRWLFCFRHLDELENQPETIQGGIFDQLFTVTETDNLTTEDMATYTNSAREYWNMYMDKDYYRDEGRDEGILVGEKRGILKGRKEGKKEGLLKGRSEGHIKGRIEGLLLGRQETLLEMAGNLLRRGMLIEDISQITGLTPAQIQQIKI